VIAKQLQNRKWHRRPAGEVWCSTTHRSAACATYPFSGCFETAAASYFRPLALLLLACALCTSQTTLAATVALTTTVSAGATEDDKQLIGNLLDLLQVEADGHPELDVVERQQLDLALHELVVSNSQSDTAKLQLGKLAAANLLLTAKLLPPDNTGTTNMHVRVTEPQTAVIRGETLVPTSAKQIEDTAAEIIDYLAIIAKGPDKRSATIAVLPFESVEQFDRLRPLERGLRDLFTSYLLQQNRFRVVQRTSMEQLLGELELVRSGLTRDGAGLENTPEREAVYVLRGEIDERILPDGNLIIIRAELVDARSRKVVATVERTTNPTDVADAVTLIATELTASIANGSGRPPATKTTGAKEIDRLYQLALRDVYRFIRYLPDDAGYHPFRVPGVAYPRIVLAEVDPSSPLGVALLDKSIDRLESVLFIEPERLTAALPLAYCLSFHVDGIWRPAQCEALLHRVRDESNDVLMQETAIRLLGDMYFTHAGCLYSENEVAKIDPELAQLGFERRLEACESLAKIGRSTWISQRFEMLEKLSDCDSSGQRWAALLHTAGKVVEHPSTAKMNQESQSNLAGAGCGAVAKVLRSKQASPALKKQAEDLLRQWAKSNNRWLWTPAARHLITFDLGGMSYDEFNARLDELFADVKTPFEQQALTTEKTWLAMQLRDKKQIEQALHVLESFEAKDQSGELGYDFTYSHYGYYLARCYEDLGRKQEALEAYMHYVQMPTNYYPAGDFIPRIKRLGGVPLRADREIDVRYLDLASGKPFYCRVLATDGKRLYCAGGFQYDGGGPQAIPIKSIRALDLESGEWTSLGGPDDRVSCLAVADGQLWAGTDHSGLWRMNIATNHWRQWSIRDGLPTNSIVAVAAAGGTAYASAANIDASRQVVSGGMVRVGDDGVHIYRDADAPLTAPQRIAIEGHRLVAIGVGLRLHILDLENDRWSKPPNRWSHLVAAGPSGLWTAPREFIATLVDEEFEAVKSFEAAGRLPKYHSDSNLYHPRFFLERDGNLWIGGEPWRRFGDSGLFRLDLATGQLTRFGPRDGFRYDDNNSYTTYAGVWAGGRLWVATSFGLAEVMPRKDAAGSPAKPPAATD
jgi:TolB-like protein/tetratricopeptide (TPR) repeat protein